MTNAMVQKRFTPAVLAGDTEGDKKKLSTIKFLVIAALPSKAASTLQH